MDGYIARIINEAQSFDIQINEVAATKLYKHLQLVLEKNKQINLTSITSLDNAITLHITDSLLFASQTSFTATTFVDIGTGAGFPGIPLAISTGAQATLCESLQKKARATQEFVEELELKNCQVVSRRAEDIARINAKSFDIVVARAVADAEVLIEYAAPLLKFGGQLVISKGNISADELEAALYVAELCGFGDVSRETFELPNNYGTRTLLKLQKEQDAKIELPRRNGMATKRPLSAKVKYLSH